MAATKKRTTKRPKKRVSKGKKSGVAIAEPPQAPKEFRVHHRQDIAFKQLFVDGTLLRTQGDDLVLIFYQDTRKVIGEIAKLKSQEGAMATYTSNKVEDKHERIDLLEIRMNVATALNMVEASFERLKTHPKFKEMMKTKAQDSSNE